MNPMEVPRFKVGDKIRTVTGWQGVIVKKHNPRSHRGFKIRWTDTLDNRFTKVGDTTNLTPLNLQIAIDEIS